MKFTDFICFKATVPELEATSRNGVISELVSALDEAGMLGTGNREKITKKRSPFTKE